MSIEWHINLRLGDIAAAVEALKIPSAMKALEMVRAHVAEGTPVETGNLVGSESVEPQPSGARIFIPGPYARRQEYGLDFHHNVGHALYLTLPMINDAEAVLKMIAEDVKGVS